MEGLFYNVNGGYVLTVSLLLYKRLLTLCSYVEGIVRGYRNTLLTGLNYGNLTQCETIDGMLSDLVLPQDCVDSC